jgi:hypothetical protein
MQQQQHWQTAPARRNEEIVFKLDSARWKDSGAFFLIIHASKEVQEKTYFHSIVK